MGNKAKATRKGGGKINRSAKRRKRIQVTIALLIALAMIVAAFAAFLRG